MKKYKIEFQSFSDVITNSSSTVFLVDKNTAEELYKMVPDSCIYSYELTWDEICPEIFNIEDMSTLTTCQLQEINSNLYNVSNNVNMVLECLSNDTDELVIKDQEWFDSTNTYGLDNQDVKKYYDFCHDNKELIEDKFIGKVFVDIEDHFENTEEVYDYASNNSIWEEYRH